MRVQNSDIAEIFDTMADLLEIEGANLFRVRAYREAARTFHDLTPDVADVIERNGGLPRLPGIGKDLEAKVGEIVRTGTLRQLEEIKERTPESLLSLKNIPGLGPKRIRALFDELHVRGLDDLRKLVARNGHALERVGFGGKTVAAIRQEVQRSDQQRRRVRLDTAESVAVPLRDYLAAVPGVLECVVAGSCRRRLETVGDLDLLVTCRRNTVVMEHFLEYPKIQKVVSKGATRSTVLMKGGLQVDLRVVPRESYGAALLYFTGSKPHGIALRKSALARKIKINEYGAFKGERRIAGRSEEEMYAALDLPYLEPELRENRGEIEAARNGTLPRLIRLEDLRGDLHAHTTETDGRSSLPEMVTAARELGYSYFAVTDHTQRLAMTRGLDPKRLRQQMRAIDRLNAKLSRFTVLKGSEVDIMEDGTLDLNDDVLSELDFRVCSAHYKFNLPREQQTERFLRALDNPLCNIIGHLTGRKIGVREPYAVDVERILIAAKERGVAVEVSAQPERLDLSDVHCRLAKDIGVKLAISTDAHSTGELELIRYGVDQARRGWIEAPDVINTRTLTQLKKFFKRK